MKNAILIFTLLSFLALTSCSQAFCPNTCANGQLPDTNCNCPLVSLTTNDPPVVGNGFGYALGEGIGYAMDNMTALGISPVDFTTPQDGKWDLNMTTLCYDRGYRLVKINISRLNAVTGQWQLVPEWAIAHIDIVNQINNRAPRDSKPVGLTVNKYTDLAGNPIYVGFQNAAIMPGTCDIYGLGGIRTPYQIVSVDSN